MKFIKINDNLRIRLEDIFILKSDVLNINKEWEKWNNNCNEYINSIMPCIKSTIPTFKINDNESSYNIDNPDVIKYVKNIKDEIDLKFGKEPDKYNYEYKIILSNGVNFDINKNTYNILKDIFDKNCINKDEN